MAGAAGTNAAGGACAGGNAGAAASDRQVAGETFTRIERQTVGHQRPGGRLGMWRGTTGRQHRRDRVGQRVAPEHRPPGQHLK